jgi:MFS family permease
MSAAAQQAPAIAVRHVAAVVVGNALEFYDFLTYAFFAVYIGRTFFPSSDPTSSLLSSLVVFGVGFVTRPLGGLVIGVMGDRVGRKPAMLLSFTLMGIAIIGLAITPSYEAIGVTAPVLVVLFRMLQGFALGGEVGPTTAFLVEAAPPSRRGFYAAFQSWTQNLSIFIAGLVGLGLSSVFTDSQLQQFGWRIAFFFGALIVPVGLVMRRRLPETVNPRRTDQPRRPLGAYRPVVVIGLVLLASATIGAYVDDYMTTYAISTLQMPSNVAFSATIVVGLCGLTFDLVSGALSDRFGRKPVMLVPGLLLLMSILPAFAVINHFRTTTALLGATAVLASLASLSSCPMVTWLTESLPPEVRSGGVAIVYAVAIATFGGSTQFIITWLIKTTGNPLAPAWYRTAAMTLGIVAMIVASESRPRDA